jgi:hypothetical protein
MRVPAIEAAAVEIGIYAQKLIAVRHRKIA